MADFQYASKGVAGAGLGLGIAGTALGLLNGGLTNWVNGNTRNANTPGNTACSEDQPVSRFELEMQQKISELQSQVALRDANTYGDQKLLEVYKYFDGELKELRQNETTKWTAQEVFNAKVSAGIDVVNSKISGIDAVLSNITRTAVPSSAICNFGCGCCSTVNT